jgi:hypothetical protein
MDDEIDELERRVEELEKLFVVQDDPTNECSQQRRGRPGWDVVHELEGKVSSLESALNPHQNELVVGGECLAFSVADGAWLEAVVEERPGGASTTTSITSQSDQADTSQPTSASSSRNEAAGGGDGDSGRNRAESFTVRFVASGQRRGVAPEELRPHTVDLAAVRSLEEAVQALATERLPVSDDLTGAPFPLAVPLTHDAQRAIAFEAEVIRMRKRGVERGCPSTTEP